MTHAQSGLRHLGISADEAVLFERLASRVLGTDGSLRASADTIASNELGQSGSVAARHLRRSADPARPRRRRRRCAAGAAGPAGAGVLAAEGAERRRRDPQRASGQLPRRDAGAAHGHPRRRSVEHLAASARAARICSAPTGWAAPSGCCSRRSRARFCAATAATCGRSSIGPTRCRRRAPPARADGAAAQRRRSTAARAATPAHDARQRARRLHGRRTDLRDRRSTARRKRRCPGRTSSPTRGSARSSRRPGAAHTWSGNSRENRLTPFANDPVSDPTAEALFVRDDETGESWSPTPGPMSAHGDRPMSSSATRPA